MNKEQLLRWAAKYVMVWPQQASEVILTAKPAGGSWVWDGRRAALISDVDCDASPITRGEWEAARAACGISSSDASLIKAEQVRYSEGELTLFSSVEDTPVTAHSILEAAGGHMRDRAATYDKPEGERSMGATVKAFRAITDHKLTEEQGWLFMQLLKAVRSQQGAYRADSYEDGAAYVALAGEAAARERGSNRAEG